MTTTPDAESPQPLPKNGPRVILDEYIRMRAPKIEGGEGYTLQNDLETNKNDEMSLAAFCYAMPDRIRKVMPSLGSLPILWPWSPYAWKPTPEDRIHELARAGALIAAEIDRLMAEAQR